MQDHSKYHSTVKAQHANVLTGTLGAILVAKSDPCLFIQGLIRLIDRLNQTKPNSLCTSGPKLLRLSPRSHMSKKAGLSQIGALVLQLEENSSIQKFSSFNSGLSDLDFSDQNLRV